MADKIENLLKNLDKLFDKIGSSISLLLLLIMFAIGAATVSRYFFGKPIPVIWPFIKQIFGLMILLGAPYAMLHNKHIRVEILYDFFPGWLKKISHVVSLMVFLALTASLVWQGVVMAKMSLMLKEVSQQAPHIPIYPFKIFLPVATILFLIYGIRYFLFHEKPDK